MDFERRRKIAEGVAAVPGVGAALYAAIAYDQGSDPNGLLVAAFAHLAEWQASFLDGTYYPKLTMLLMALPLIAPPVAAVKLWFRRKATETSAAEPG